MNPAVLFEVIPTAEPFRADQAGERSKAGVNPLVASELLVPGEGFPARFFVAFEWSFTFNLEKKNLLVLNVHTFFKWSKKLPV